MTSKGAKVKEKRIIALKYGTFFSIAALFILLLLAVENHEIWAQAVEPLQKPQKEETKPSDKKAETSPTRGPVKDTLPPPSYTSIAEKNIFSPNRKDFPAPAGVNKAIVRPQVILYGVTIAGDYQAASVSNPGRPLQKGERETFTVKLGEKIGDYKVASISSDRITLEVDADRFEVLLYDSRTPKKRIEVKTETKPATITSTQPAPATPAPGTAAPSTPPVSAQAPRPSSPPAAATPSSPATVTPAPPATRTPTVSPSTTRGGRTYYPPSGTSGTPGSTTQGTDGN